MNMYGVNNVMTTPTPIVPDNNQMRNLGQDNDWTLDMIVNNFTAFEMLNENEKRNSLGKLMYNAIGDAYPQIKNDTSLVGKVTMILIDFETFKIREIIDLMR